MGTSRQDGGAVYLVTVDEMAISWVSDVGVVDEGVRVGKWLIRSWFAWWCRGREI